MTKLHELVERWREEAKEPHLSADVRATLIACTGELAAALAEQGWRPIAEMPADGSVWRFRMGEDKGLVRSWQNEPRPWDPNARPRYSIVLLSEHGGFSLTSYHGSLDGAMVAPLPPAPGDTP